MKLRLLTLASVAAIACLALSAGAGADSVSGSASSGSPAASASAKAKAFKFYTSCQSKVPFKASRVCGFDSSTQAKVALLAKSNVGPYMFKFCAKIPTDFSCATTPEPLVRAVYRLTVTLIGKSSAPVKFTVFAKNPNSPKGYKRVARTSMRVVK